MNVSIANFFERIQCCPSLAIGLLLGISILTGGLARSAAAREDSTFELANQAFAQGQYDEAVKEYTDILSKRGFAAGVLVNRANAWQKLNEPGHAILDFERALWLRPADGSIAAELKRAQLQAGVAVTQPTMFRRGISLVSFEALGWVICGAALALASFVLIAQSRRSKWSSAVKAAVAACTVIGIAAGTALVVRWPELDRAVVLEASTPVRVAPAAAADVSFNLPAGDVVDVANRYQGYVKLRSADGRSGWADARSIARIVGSIAG